MAASRSGGPGAGLPLSVFGWFAVGVLYTRVPLILCFAAFVVTFLVTRVITRMIRSGRGPFRDRVTSSGVHVHHAVPGLFLLLAGAVTAVGATEPLFRCVAGAAVGIGASLVLDEFALILHLSDVYWAEQGRASVQAVALVAACLLLALLGFAPVNADDLHGHPLAFVPPLVIWATLIAASVVCVRKGKYRLVLLSIFLLIPAYVGAIRLARPGSPWFGRRYPLGSAKRDRAIRRAARTDARWNRRWLWLADLIAGAPTIKDPPAGQSGPEPGSEQVAGQTR
jgi:hypothetical protein